jgi:uncharacterized protein
MDNNFLIKRRPIMIGFTLLFIISVVLLSSNLTGKSFAATEASQPTKRTLNVTGQGTVTATPDIAYITLGVITEDVNAKIAQQKNADAMSEVINQIKKSGVKSEDIKTVNYNIYPKSDYNNNTGVSKIVGYTVNNSVVVTVRDISKVGNIIDIAGASGSNLSSGISFGLSDYEKYYNEALKQAVTIAKKRATTIGGTLGITLKTPVSVSESGSSGPIINYPMYDMKSSAEAVTPIQSGNMDIKATVNMTYEY